MSTTNEVRRELSYDGHGVNGPDEYRTRIATLNPALPREERDRYGAMFEASPEVLAALRDVLGFLDTSDVRHLWAKKGESSALTRVLNNARKLARG